MRIALFALYTLLFIWMLYSIMRVRGSLVSKAWNYISFGFLALLASRYSVLIALLYPRIRQTPEAFLVIQIVYHVFSMLAILAITRGFTLLGNNLKKFLKPEKKEEKKQEKTNEQETH